MRAIIVGAPSAPALETKRARASPPSEDRASHDTTAPEHNDANVIALGGRLLGVDDDGRPERGATICTERDLDGSPVRPGEPGHGHALAFGVEGGPVHRATRDLPTVSMHGRRLEVGAGHPAREVHVPDLGRVAVAEGHQRPRRSRGGVGLAAIAGAVIHHLGLADLVADERSVQARRPSRARRSAIQPEHSHSAPLGNE